MKTGIKSLFFNSLIKRWFNNVDFPIPPVPCIIIILEISKIVLIFSVFTKILGFFRRLGDSKNHKYTGVLFYIK